MAQLAGLATAVVGGLFLNRRRHRRQRAGAPAGGPAARWLLALLAVVLGGSLLTNLLQWGWGVDDHNRRLQTNLVRSSMENGRQVGDTSLKTLAFSDQLQHPLGVTTADLERMLSDSARGKGRVNLIDVREPEEREVGRISGFAETRYPDLMSSTADKLADGDNVLMCYSGNRSSELCDALAAKGISCRFVIGGYEKWVAEGGQVDFPAGRPKGDIRGIPSYPNRDTLLDTPEVTRAVREEGAIFVDVRYPEDFEIGHLPGAINMPIRKMPTDELQAALRAVPEKPVIAPCYDKRSCFYAKILGLRLSRLGYDFRGRYTVPNEFVPPDSRAAQALAGPPSLPARIFDAAAERTRDALAWIERTLGSFTLALIATVVLFRLFASPFTIKSERDQAVLQSLDGEIEKIRKAHEGDSRRCGQDLRKLYRQNRLSPGINVFGILLQVPLFITLFTAVDSYAAERGGSVLWYSDAAASDPLLLLPMAIGALVFMQLSVGARRQTLKLNTIRGAAALGLAAITAPLSAAVNTYLFFSVLLMVGQSLIVRSGVSAKRSGTAQGSRILPLHRADQVPGTGTKAARLGQMARAGLPVPGGFVIAGAAGDQRHLSRRDRRRMSRLWRRLGLARVAVRSSGLNEDGANRSFAGVFDTVLDVGRGDLESAIDRVRASMTGDRAAHYVGDDETGGVVVQAMVPAAYAGVMFTRHPANPAATLVELAQGLGDQVVDGSVEPEAYLFGRVSGKTLDDHAPPIDLRPLIALGRRLEGMFDGPQDVEWAFADGGFHILQSRNITASAGGETALDREQDRLISLFRDREPDDVVLVQTDIAELLPHPTAFSQSFMERLWAPGGSVERACRRLGVPYDAGDGGHYLATVLGRLYVNKAVHDRRFRRGPGPLSSFRIARNADAIEAQFREQFLPAFEHDMHVLAAIDPARLEDAALLELLRQVATDFIEHHYVEAHVINVAAERYVAQAQRSLGRQGLPTAQYLAGMPETVVHQAMALLAQAGSGDADARQAFLRLYGHRGPYDYEFAEPRYREMAKLPYVPGFGASAGSECDADRHGRLVHVEIERAYRYQILKEEAKHHCLLELAAIRLLLLDVDRRFALGGHVFHLTMDEVLRLGEPEFAKVAAGLADGRARDFEPLKALPAPPAEVTASDLERLGRAKGKRAPRAKGQTLAGTVVAGSLPVQGRARIVNGVGLGTFQDGEILVVRSLHPDLVAAFGRVGGVVSEIGGWLSHAAILAREYGVPTVVGVAGATTSISDGDLVRLDPGGALKIVQGPDTPNQTPMDGPRQGANG